MEDLKATTPCLITDSYKEKNTTHQYVLIFIIELIIGKQQRIYPKMYFCVLWTITKCFAPIP